MTSEERRGRAIPLFWGQLSVEGIKNQNKINEFTKKICDELHN
jgi:hypothetical protein